MITRTTRLGLLAATLAIVASACGGAATPTPSVAPSAAPSVAASVAPSVAPSEAPSPSPAAAPKLKIGVVTDVGTLDDKNFNEFSYAGAVKGAADIGSDKPQAIVTQNTADYAKNIQSFVDQKYDVIVTIGFAIGNDTAAAALANPGVKFIGVDQGVCVDETGKVDPTYGCKGDPTKLLPNYQGLVFKEDQPGYLAGVVAASISKSGVVGTIGGTKTIPPVVRYIQGFYLGAIATNPNVKVKIGWVSDDLGKAFNDPAGGKLFTQQFIKANPGLDVMFQVAGKTGNGILSAACDAKIHAIGVDVDQYLSYPDAKACIVTSAEKKLSNAVEAAIQRIPAKTDVGGTITNDASNDGVGLAPYYDFASLITPEIQAKIDAALAGMKDGSIKTDTPLPAQYLK
jgi:basic membrane protein A